MSRVFKLKDRFLAIAGFYPLDVASDATTKEFLRFAFAAENPRSESRRFDSRHWFCTPFVF